MRSILPVVFFPSLMLCLPLLPDAPADANFELTVDGVVSEIALDKEYQGKTRSGQTFMFRLAKKAMVRYSGKMVSFQHKSDKNVSVTELGAGIRQSVLVTALGTIAMVQEYPTLDPSGLVSTMLKELTKEEVNYGYKLATSSIGTNSVDGRKLVGTRAVSTYRDNQKTWTVLTCAGKDCGVLVVTCIDKQFKDQDSEMLETFWKTLTLDL